MEYHPAVKNVEVVAFSVSWMTLEDVTESLTQSLSEVNQKE